MCRCSKPATAWPARASFRPPAHLDLLHGARRLWKLRLDSCRLVDLENQNPGPGAQGDLPGEMIPYCYFEYLRTHQAFQLVPIFHHNVMDIVSLACLTAVVRSRFVPRRTPRCATRGPGGLARWLAQAERYEEAVRLYRRAVEPRVARRSVIQDAMGNRQAGKEAGRYESALAVIPICGGPGIRTARRALEELGQTL